MRVPTLLLFACFGASACAQAVFQVDTIRAVQPWAPHEVYTFPRLVIPARPAVAARINTHLSIDFLEVDPDTAHGHYFDKVWGDTVGWTTPRLSYLGWEVRQPLPNVLEVELSGEGCGAYCEGFITSYHYDLHNGRYLTKDSLFTPPGIAALNDTLYARWRSTLTAYIASVLDSVADPHVDTAAVEEMKATMELYQNCLDERADGDPYTSDFTVSASGLRFFIARCAPHVVQELDVLDPIAFELPYAICKPWMRAEVKELFP